MGLEHSIVERIKSIVILYFSSGAILILEQLGEKMSLNLGSVPRGWQ